jgi:hypothetical protein
VDATIIAAGITAVPVLIASLAQWRDMRKRTNGSGPLAAQLRGMDAKLDAHGERLGRIEERQARTDERVGRIEQQVTAGAVADRAEETRIARRESR